jgi:diguanylate cyclase (GGDEF)-like protein
MINECLDDFSKASNCEHRLICKDGSYKWFISSARVSAFEGGKPVLITGILLDISQRKDSEIALQYSERKYRDLFNTMGEGFALHEIILNESGTAADYMFIDINKAFERLTRLKRKNIIGKTVKEVMPDIEASWTETYRKAASTGKPQSFENYAKYSGRYYNVYAYSPEKGKLASLFRDITEQKINENNLKYLSFHDKLTGLYNRAYFEEELVRLNTSRDLPLSIIIGDVNSLKLLNDAFGHSKGDILLKEITKVLKNTCRAEDIIARWGGDEFALLLPRTTQDIAARIIERIQEKCRRIKKLNIPVSISLGAATKERNDENILKLLVLAEDNMYSNKLLDRKSISSSIITSLTQTLSEKSVETERHADRLKKLALKIGHELKLPQKDLDKLALLALLHDIGKISMPDRIFSKSSRLTKAEWKEIKKHPETGYNICNSSPMITHLADDILAHHEWWDGSGYPQKISGKNIPLLSRIIFIIDAYDVMVKGRPYKSAMTKKAAAEELKRCAGTQFDPFLVDVFIKVVS